MSSGDEPRGGIDKHHDVLSNSGLCRKTDSELAGRPEPSNNKEDSDISKAGLWGWRRGDLNKPHSILSTRILCRKTDSELAGRPEPTDSEEDSELDSRSEQDMVQTSRTAPRATLVCAGRQARAVHCHATDKHHIVLRTSGLCRKTDSELAGRPEPSDSEEDSELDSGDEEVVRTQSQRMGSQKRVAKHDPPVDGESILTQSCNVLSSQIVCM